MRRFDQTPMLAKNMDLLAVAFVRAVDLPGAHAVGPLAKPGAQFQISVSVLNRLQGVVATPPSKL